MNLSRSPYRYLDGTNSVREVFTPPGDVNCRLLNPLGGVSVNDWDVASRPIRGTRRGVLMAVDLPSLLADLSAETGVVDGLLSALDVAD